MALLGRATLILALALAAWGMAASIAGGRRSDPRLIRSGRRAVYAVTLVVTVCFAILELAFLRSDYSFATVASHSSSTTPLLYRAAAVWSSQEGSLLLWVWLLSLWSSVAVTVTRRRLQPILPYATAVLLGFAAFFLMLLVVYASPFMQLSPVPHDGAGLDPLLRHPSMMIHPPLLYSGYTLFTIPFAFAVAALLTRRLDSSWITATRRFSLGAWLALGIGIILGARWSYAELGWGGYWAWDPVENASLMPWLTGTAFLHSVMIQEKRGMLKVWNVGLVLATGTLAILGTFLVRSGILDSIHAFGASTLGLPFFVLIAAMIAGSIALVASRRAQLRSDHSLSSVWSREAAFLANNLVLVALCFTILWGTLFPLISEALTGSKSSVGPPWFGRYTVPLALALVLLAGVGPVIAWRRCTPAHLRRHFSAPILAAIVVLAVVLASGGARKPLALALFALAAFSIATVIQELGRGTAARRAVTGRGWGTELVSLVGRNRRRYGGYVVHLGIATLLIGVAASSSFQHIADVRLAVGQSVKVGGYTMQYVRPTGAVLSDPRRTGALMSLGAVVRVAEGSRTVAILRPTAGYYPSGDRASGSTSSLIDGDTVSGVGLKSSLTRDLWSAVQPDIGPLSPLFKRANQIVPADRPDVALFALAAIVHHYLVHPPPAQFRLISSPLVMWIWIGAVISFGGGALALWPAAAALRRRRWLLSARPVSASQGAPA
jgi:cytochrome c-type biogenesis protein CcmF